MSMIVDAVVNRRSARKYGEFLTAMNQAWIVLEDIRRIIRKLDGAWVPSGFRSASVDDLLELSTRAERSLQELESKSRRYQAELVSREWRL